MHEIFGISHVVEIQFLFCSGQTAGLDMFSKYNTAEKHNSLETTYMWIRQV